MADERKGVFTPEQEDFLATILDDFFKFKNPLIETFDKTAFKLLISIVDNQGLNRINASWKAGLIPIIDAALLLDVEEVRRLSTDLLNVKIDIPGIDEETELLVFDTFTRFLVAAVNWFVQKQKAKGVTEVVVE